MLLIHERPQKGQAALENFCVSMPIRCELLQIDIEMNAELSDISIDMYKI